MQAALGQSVAKIIAAADVHRGLFAVQFVAGAAGGGVQLAHVAFEGVPIVEPHFPGHGLQRVLHFQGHRLGGDPVQGQAGLGTTVAAPGRVKETTGVGHRVIQMEAAVAQRGIVPIDGGGRRHDGLRLLATPVWQ